MYVQIKINKSIVIFLILFLLRGSIFAQQGWYNLNQQFGGGIFFKDINNGIIGAYKTTNAGINWLYMGYLTGGRTLSFPEPNTGFGLAGGNLIVKTTNFGVNWTQQSNPSTFILFDINFPNVNTGFACGESSSSIKTTNGGNNWNILSTPVSSSDYILTNVFFSDSITGYIAGYNYRDTSVFLKTTNCGNSWTTLYYHISSWGSFTAMFFINANTGFIGASSNSNILKTTNGGAGWNNILIPTTNRINSLYFPSASTGYASCYGGQILKTTNGGNNWFLQTTNTGSILYSIFFINNLTGYCSGDNNTVLKTTDGGGPPIGINQISAEVPKDFRLDQNYPNPFNPVTNIKFEIPKLSFVKLIVYDMLGREAETLVNEQLNAGTYEINFDGGKLASGIYLYAMKTENFSSSKKLVLIK
jgi:photosystem II stability/assembly factor-like uncharacterized protein